MTISRTWRHVTRVSNMMVIDFDSAPRIPSNMIAPQILKNFLTACLVHIWPDFTRQPKLLIIIFALIEQQDFGSIDISFPRSYSTENKHDFLFSQDCLSSSIYYLSACLLIVAEFGLTTFGWANVLIFRQVCPWL